MSNHSFTLWLNKEVTSMRCSLLVLYEKRDKMKYIDGPQLEKEYMDKIGSFEEAVIREELECEILRKKQQMIQTALNRHEIIDEAAIDAELESYRKQLMKEAEGAPAPQEFAELSPEQSEELQKTYRNIVDNYHPHMHPDLTKTHRQLFEKAQEAYRRRDLSALKLIYEMLLSADSKDDIQLMEVMLSFTADAGTSDEQNVDFLTDYTLSGLIYSKFRQTAEEAAIEEELSRYRDLSENVITEIEKMQMEFPYTASEMLSDSDKIEEYRKELELRLRTATAERERRTKEIREMIESVATHE